MAQASWKADVSIPASKNPRQSAVLSASEAYPLLKSYDDVYLNKLQTKGVKKSLLYMYNVDQPIRHK
jgi:IMP cyclohydrolase